MVTVTMMYVVCYVRQVNVHPTVGTKLHLFRARSVTLFIVRDERFDCEK